MNLWSQRRICFMKQRSWQFNDQAPDFIYRSSNANDCSFTKLGTTHTNSDGITNNKSILSKLPLLAMTNSKAPRARDIGAHLPVPQADVPVHFADDNLDHEDRGYRCRDGRLHNTQQEAEACRLCCQENRFDRLPKLSPPTRQKRKARPIVPPPQEDIEDNIIVTAPRYRTATPTPPPRTSRTPSATPSTPRLESEQEPYPTPPVSQNPERIGCDSLASNQESAAGLAGQTTSPPMPRNNPFNRSRSNIASSSWVQVNGMLDMDMENDIATPTQPYHQAIDSSRDVSSPTLTTRVAETVFDQQGRPAHHSIENGGQTDYERALANLRIARAELRQALDDAVGDDDRTDGQLRELLRDKAARLDRLRTRVNVEQAKVRAKDEEIRRSREDLDASRIAVDRARADVERMQNRGNRTSALVVLVVVASLLYVGWCWYRRPEFAWQRKHQFELYGMDPRDYD